MNKKKYRFIVAVFILVFFGWYVYYNTSLTYLTFGRLLSGNIKIGKYLQCSQENEYADIYLDDKIPAECCRGLKQVFFSDNSRWTMPGEIGICVK